METYEVRFLQEALDDLEEIILYISKDNREAALQMHDNIIEKSTDLEVFPKRGRLILDKKMAASGFRMLVIKPYLMFYRVIGHDVFIYRILHGATNYPLLYEKMEHSNPYNDSVI